MANEPIRKDAGIVTAYGAAVRGGYTGTYEDFCRQQAEYADTAAAVAQAKVDAEAAARRAEAAVESYDEMTAAATGLPHGSDPTSEIDRTGEHPVLRLGIPDGAQGNPGEDGYSPTVSITTISGGHRVTITDRTGDHTADIMDGDKGDPGNDGYSPTVTITDITGGHRITITDKTGNHTADVMDGDKGDPGNDGFSPTVTVTNITDGHRVTITDAQGAHAFDVLNGSGVEVTDTEPTNPNTKMWIRATESSSVQVPTYQEFTTEQERVNRALTDKANTSVIADDYDSTSTYAVGDYCIHEGVLYKCNTAISTAEAWTAAHWTATAVMLETGGGSGVSDVQVNGTSIVQDGVANVPVAGGNILGVARASSGLSVNNGAFSIDKALNSESKDGSNAYKPIVPQNQHTAAFYGLAKAAGDSTQSASSNAVGTYTESAKSAISQMLDAPETVSGTTPSISAKAGITYKCGEVSTLYVTPCASGDCEIIFTSGTTPTVLTVPNTVVWAGSFDSTSLDADTVYDMIITDGVYGMVASWAV